MLVLVNGRVVGEIHWKVLAVAGRVLLFWLIELVNEVNVDIIGLCQVLCCHM